MESSFNLLSTLTLLGAVQGIFLSLVLVRASNGDTQAHRTLSLITLIFSLDLGEEFLYQIGFFASAPGLLHLLAPIDLLYGPLIYIYVSQLTNPAKREGAQKRYWHFLPVPIGMALLLPFFFLEGSAKLAFTETLRKGNGMEVEASHALLVVSGFTLFILGTVAQLGIYLLLSIKRLIQHSRRIKDQFSDIDRINLAWLRNLLLGLGCIFLLYLGDQFFPDLMALNILGDLITVIAVVLIYTMGYLGLRQPAIFTRGLLSQHAATKENPDPTKEKYLRSGLDRQTSRVFLDELTTHMETNKPYLEGSLVLPQLAQQLRIPTNYLSQVINEQLHINFYDFVNGYRVEEAKRLMSKKGKENTNILHIALDAGFNSKSAFYAAFKKATSITPTQYRRSL